MGSDPGSWRAINSGRRRGIGKTVQCVLVSVVCVCARARLGGTGILMGMLATNTAMQPSYLAITGLVTGIVFGLIIYLTPVIYLACTQVKCEQTAEDQITFSRVSSAFTRAASLLRK
jgi:uncharacterized membrane protein